jgi:hypothetical protein
MSEHHAERISGDLTCSVHRCECGQIHIHIGAITVRLDAEAFPHLASVLWEAALAFGAGAPEASRPGSAVN